MFAKEVVLWLEWMLIRNISVENHFSTVTETYKWLAPSILHICNIEPARGLMYCI